MSQKSATPKHITEKIQSLAAWIEIYSDKVHLVMMLALAMIAAITIPFGLAWPMISATMLLILISIYCARPDGPAQTWFLEAQLRIIDPLRREELKAFWEYYRDHGDEPVLKRKMAIFEFRNIAKGQLAQ